MPMPDAMRRLNKVGLNKVMIHLGGHGNFATVEHIGRTSGTVRHTPILAFRDGQVLTLALTYGPKVDWLRNLRAAGGGRILHRGQWLGVGAPHDLSTAEGMARMPALPHLILPLTGTTEFVQLPILGPS